MTQSAGWLRPDHSTAAETVVARFHRADLPTGLAELHGRGLGHTARVLDPARGPIDEQFRRSGISADLGFTQSTADDVFLLVGATGRSAIVGDLLLHNGAAEVRIYRPGDPSTVVPDTTGTGIAPPRDAALPDADHVT